MAINVLVVDDSAFMRKAISNMLESDPDIKVLATARDGEEGLEKISKLKPDLVTLDLEMPRMDGLTALEHIMAEMPLPVMIISSLTTDGAEPTLRALELGAVDYIPKNLSYVSLDIVKIEQDLISKVKTIAKRKFVPRRGPSISRKIIRTAKKESRSISMVAIGASTGGPPALQNILTSLPKDFPAGVLVVQHMPQAFTGPFAERLNQSCEIEVREATKGDRVSPGVALIAPGGIHISVNRRFSSVDVELSEGNSETIYKPSVDIMMRSVAKTYGPETLGVILTGMGSDGLEGMRAIKRANGKTLAQDEDSCVVYGMPKAVVDAGLADKVLPLPDMAEEIVKTI